MNFQQDNILKLCSFYVSDWHLITMLLPYINKKVDEEINIATILQNSIEKNIHTLIEKLNIKNEEKILNLNWTSTNGQKYSNISKLLEKNIKPKEELLLIVNGTKEYIKSVNENINKYLEKMAKQTQEKTGEKEQVKIKIINCYEIVEFNGSIQEILDSHDKILNTSGEKEITDIFEDYERKSAEVV